MYKIYQIWFIYNKIVHVNCIYAVYHYLYVMFFVVNHIYVCSPDGGNKNIIKGDELH